MNFSEEQLEILINDPASLKAGKALVNLSKWTNLGLSERVIWGEIKGSGTKPYYTQIDINEIAYKCSCPSFKFPCKHSVALLFLSVRHREAFENSTEPDWVFEWIEKRQVRLEKQKQTPEKSEEETIKTESQKLKRQDDRNQSVAQALNDLEIWLKDLVRTGLINLPQRDQSSFEHLAKRLIDNKASGLSSWIRALGKIDYSNEKWADEALEICSKLFLLIKAYQNLDAFNETFQISVKNLIGWSQSQKELLESPDAHSIKDVWLVLGQENEQQDDIQIQRNWLWGIESGQTALILNFGTRHSPLVNNLIQGSSLEAELLFFPAVHKQRAVIKLQRGLIETLKTPSGIKKNWKEVFSQRADLLAQFPWVSDVPAVVEDLLFFPEQKRVGFIDSEKNFVPISSSVDHSKVLEILALAGSSKHTIAGVLRKNTFLPLGVFQNNVYQTLIDYVGKNS